MKEIVGYDYYSADGKFITEEYDVDLIVNKKYAKIAFWLVDRSWCNRENRIKLEHAIAHSSYYSYQYSRSRKVIDIELIEKSIARSPEFARRYAIWVVNGDPSKIIHDSIMSSHEEKREYMKDFIEYSEGVIDEIKSELLLEYDFNNWGKFIDQQEIGQCQDIVHSIMSLGIPRIERHFGEIKTEDKILTHHWVTYKNTILEFSKGTFGDEVEWDDRYSVYDDGEIEYGSDISIESR